MARSFHRGHAPQVLGPSCSLPTGLPLVSSPVAGSTVEAWEAIQLREVKAELC